MVPTLQGVYNSWKPGNPGNLLKFKNPPGNPGNLEFSGPLGNFYVR